MHCSARTNAWPSTSGPVGSTCSGAAARRVGSANALRAGFFVGRAGVFAADVFAAEVVAEAVTEAFVADGFFAAAAVIFADGGTKDGADAGCAGDRVVDVCRAAPTPFGRSVMPPPTSTATRGTRARTPQGVKPPIARDALRLDAAGTVAVRAQRDIGSR